MSKGTIYIIYNKLIPHASETLLITYIVLYLFKYTCENIKLMLRSNNKPFELV